MSQYFPYSQNVDIFGGSFETHMHIRNPPTDPFLLLWNIIKDVGGSHEAEARYPPPKCDPGTREIVRQDLLQWANPSPSTEPYPDHDHSFDAEFSWTCVACRRILTERNDPVCWLRGTVGVGKSAVAQSVAEALACRKQLVCSFFFSRNAPSRNTATYLFLSIAYGLGCRISQLRASISSIIQHDPGVLSSTLENQFKVLLVDPCVEFGQRSEGWGDSPKVVIVDGLDECVRGDQQRILQLVGDGLVGGLPLRFMIFSRPEHAIKALFDSPPLTVISSKASLKRNSQSDRDIHVFLVNRFAEIQAKYSEYNFPDPWPTPEVIEELVNKSDGQFIYATTVVKYVNNEYLDPTEQLEIVLGLSPPEDYNGAPFTDLDTLYHQILSRHPRREHLVKMLGWIVAWPKFKGDQAYHFHFTREDERQFLAEILRLTNGNVVSILRALEPVIDQTAYTGLRPYHASFTDFCTDQSRSKEFHIQVDHHISLIAAACVELIAKGSLDHTFSLAGKYHKYIWHVWGDIVVRFNSSSVSDSMMRSLRTVEVESLWNVLLEFFRRPDLEGYLWMGWQLFEAIFTISKWLETSSVPEEMDQIKRKFERAKAGFHVWISPTLSNEVRSRICSFLEYTVLSAGVTHATDEAITPNMLEGLQGLFKVVKQTPEKCQCFEALEDISFTGPLDRLSRCVAQDVYFFPFSIVRTFLLSEYLRSIPESQSKTRTIKNLTSKLVASQTGTSFLAQCIPHESFPLSNLCELAPHLDVVDWPGVEEVLFWLERFPAEHRPEDAIRIFENRKQEVEKRDEAQK